MSYSLYGEVVFNSVSAIVRKKVLLSICNFVTNKLSSHEAWVEYTSDVDFSCLYDIKFTITEGIFEV